MRLAGVVFLSLFFITGFAYPKEDTESALGFSFGISKKVALEIIKSRGKKIVEDTVDSKKIRTVVFDSTVVDLPLDTLDAEVRTSLEFYRDKLLSSSLLLRPRDPMEQQELESQLSEFLTARYGEPANREEVLNITAWTWHVDEVRVILSSDPGKNLLKVKYIYEPLNQARREEELKQRQRGKPSDPAREMFIEGNYSAPYYLKENRQ
jgi:hypothetical protein